MPTITLKNIPGPLYERLKQRAKLRHRSLNSEIIFTLERSLGLNENDPDALRQEARAFREDIAKRCGEEIEKVIAKERS